MRIKKVKIQKLKLMGIKVNNAKKVIYFLLDFAPSTLISFLIEFLISRKAKKKKNINKIMFANNKYCKLLSFS